MVINNYICSDHKNVDMNKSNIYKYLELVKDALKHFFIIVAAILSFSITLDPGQLPLISKILMILGWSCLIMALVLATFAFNTLFVTFSNILELDSACPCKDNVENLVTKLDNNCYWCINLFVIGIISLGIAAVFKFL